MGNAPDVPARSRTVRDEEGTGVPLRDLFPPSASGRRGRAGGPFEDVARGGRVLSRSGGCLRSRRSLFSHSFAFDRGVPVSSGFDPCDANIDANGSVHRYHSLVPSGLGDEAPRERSALGAYANARMEKNAAKGLEKGSEHLKSASVPRVPCATEGLRDCLERNRGDRTKCEEQISEFRKACGKS